MDSKYVTTLQKIPPIGSVEAAQQIADSGEGR
jgi:hypothetical protein